MVRKSIGTRWRNAASDPNEYLRETITFFSDWLKAAVVFLLVMFLLAVYVAFVDGE